MISLMKSCGCFAQVAKEALLVITHTKLQAVLINRPKHWRKFGSQGKQERNIFYLVLYAPLISLIFCYQFINHPQDISRTT